jgi:hypothetical protein
LKIATQIILSTSTLSLLLIGSGRYSVDTDPSTSAIVKSPIVQEVKAKALEVQAAETTTVPTTTIVSTATTTTTAVTTSESETTDEPETIDSHETTTESVEIEDTANEEEVVVTEQETLPATTESTTAQTTAQTTAAETTTTAETTTIIVYKPSTHYVHLNTCRWYNSECYEITSTEGLETRKCSECNPDIEIINEYIPETPTVADYDRQLLAEIVWHEAGSSWISQYNKAKVAAGVMNRVNDSRFPGTVYDVLTQRGQFSGYWPGCCSPTQACYDAVDYYFNHTDEFNSDNSWWGDGQQNHFYHQ